MSMTPKEQYQVLHHNKDIDISYSIVTAHEYRAFDISKTTKAKITALSEEGVIEGVATSHMFGSQFHPELKYNNEKYKNDIINRQAWIIRNSHTFTKQHNQWIRYAEQNNLSIKRVLTLKDKENIKLFNQFNIAANTCSLTAPQKCFYNQTLDKFDDNSPMLELPTPNIGLYLDSLEDI